MLIADILMIFAPVLAYVPQYQLIRQTKSLGSFSIDICAILLIGNILRIYFWFAEGFGVPLLIQSVLMIIAQLLLLKACVEAMNYKPPQEQNPPTGSQTEAKELSPNPIIEEEKTFSLLDFWRWDHYSHFLMFLAAFAFAMGITTWCFLQVSSVRYGEILGFLSLSVEATLGFPQLIKNHTAQSVQGLSYVLILSWFGGDLLKTLYFIFQNQPIPFVVCGTIQLTVDILIILQIVAYRRLQALEQKSVTTENL